MANYTVTPVDVATELDPKDIAILEGTPAPGYFIPFEDQVKVTITVRIVTGKQIGRAHV